MKKYIKPTIIDLSIEGMTGFGYGVLSSYCQDGTGVDSPSCNPNGVGVSNTCNMGRAPSSGCTDGYAPHETGGLCSSGSAANSACVSGGDAAMISGACYSGTNATVACTTGGSGASSGWCSPGESDAVLCNNGNSQIRQFS